MSSPNDHRQLKGKQGEKIAAQALERAGYTILDRNWRCAAGELDIVAQHRGEIVCVEVRSRAEGVESALESINTRKQARLRRLAEAYLAAHNLEGMACRVDVVAVCGAKVEIVEDALDW